MKTYESSELRVVGVFGHRGAGKTSLIEAMLYSARATERLGSVPRGTLTLESDPVALERQTTMTANVGFIEWSGCRIGVIDTPGDINFWGSAVRALDVVDAALVVVAAPDGIQPVTSRVIAGLRQRAVPFAIVMTHLDRHEGDLDSALAELREEVGAEVVALSPPLPGGADRGVFHLAAGKAHIADGERGREVEVPTDAVERAAAARELLIDAVAATDDELAERYLEHGGLSAAELQRGLVSAFARRALVPVFVVNPAINLGARIVLDAIAGFFPTAVGRPAIKGFSSPEMTTPVERLPDPAGPLVARVFRTYHDPFAGLLTYVRVFSGTLAAAHDVWNGNAQAADRPAHLYLPQGEVKAGVEIKQAIAGDLVVLTKLKVTGTGDTLSSRDEQTLLPPFDEPEALQSYTIQPALAKQEDKLAVAIQRMVDEDPSIHYFRDPETKETLLGGLGQPHIDHVVARLARLGVEVSLRDPKIPYRESIRAPVREIEGKHKKQTGGSGQYGVCYIHLEPLPRGSGVEFVDAVVGGSIPKNFILSVEKGVRAALCRGPVSGSEVVDVRVILYDGKYHRVDSNDMAFQAAGRKAIRAALASPRAMLILLEPLMDLEISCPAECVGDVMGDLNSRRARVHHMEAEGRRGRVSASVPMNEVLHYSNVLKSVTSGRGAFTMRFERYAEAPPEIQERVAASHHGKHAEED